MFQCHGWLARSCRSALCNPFLADPRFEKGAGSSKLNYDMFRRAYGFLASYQDSEIEELRNTLKKEKNQVSLKCHSRSNLVFSTASSGYCCSLLANGTRTVLPPLCPKTAGHSTPNVASEQHSFLLVRISTHDQYTVNRGSSGYSYSTGAPTTAVHGFNGGHRHHVRFGRGVIARTRRRAVGLEG